jgi:RNA polymerase sigma-70 factor (subfamily 1)
VISDASDQVPDGNTVPDDPVALEALLQSYLPRLRAFVRSRLVPELRVRESSLDVVQSVCRELLEHRDRFRYQGEGPFRGWLFTAAANKVSEKLRFHHQARRDLDREASAGTSLPPLAAGSSVSPSYAAIANEQIETLEAALDALGPAEREVITLSRLAGLPMATVADHLGKTESAARKQLGRALARLSVELQRLGNGRRRTT